MSDFDAIANAAMPFFHAAMGETAAVVFVDIEGTSAPPVDAILGDIRRESFANSTGEFEAEVVVERRSIRIAHDTNVDMYAAAKIVGDTVAWEIESVTDDSSYQMTVHLVREIYKRHGRQGMKRRSR